MVKSSVQFMNDPVLLLGDVLCTGTTKYSVKEDDYFSLVTVNFASSICYIKCHSGFCAAQYFKESDDVVDDNENGNFGEDVNTEDDGSLSSELESNFDKETGLWS